jgi:hypothetical protein
MTTTRASSLVMREAEVRNEAMSVCLDVPPMLLARTDEVIE